MRIGINIAIEMFAAVIYVVTGISLAESFYAVLASIIPNQQKQFLPVTSPVENEQCVNYQEEEHSHRFFANSDSPSDNLHNSEDVWLNEFLNTLSVYDVHLLSRVQI